MKGMTFNSYLAQYRILLILAELDEGPKTSRELAAALHMDRTAVPAYLKHIGAKIVDWVDGNKTPVYGPPRPGPHAGKRAAKTKAQKWREIKADPVRHARVKALQVIRARKLRDGITLPVTIVIDGNVNRR